MTIDKGNSPIEFRLDPSSGVPTYLQLVQQVEHALRLGYLKPGDQLPKVRDVVAALTINPNTVLKAYKELETKGLAAGRPGQGTFVQATLSQVTLPELSGLRRSMLGWLASAEEAGLDEDGIVALFTSALRDFFKGRQGARAATARPATRSQRNGGRRMNVIETSGLGKRYGKAWALRDCTLAVPEGLLAALVGPNGAGKSTLMNMAAGLTVPTAGTATVLGGQPTGSPAALDGIAFMAQDAPVYRNLSVADMLHLTRNLNRRFDESAARQRLTDLGIPLKKKTGKLSGGQQAQVALTVALARRPRLLILDEPLSALDPLARQDFLATVMTAMADDGVSVVLSSHALAELERVADYLVVLGGGELRLAGEVDDLLAEHQVLTGPAADADRLAGQFRRCRSSGPERRRTCWSGPAGRTGTVPPGWESHPVGLEELVLAYLRPAGGERVQPAARHPPRPVTAAHGGVR